ncbi:GRF1-interacting factor 1-like isoform X2 [Aristolochia californica]|uniref:GRF1-interacting factor 1-like isoform X2 n=1 Tax=Aristolochia californica TaxID=171875 RepID=UPI0035DC9C41
MQQHLMQMQPVMSTYNPNAVTTDIIQQYLDENKQLILTILENQNTGKLSECAQNQARLQQNLMYLAAIADSQPQPPMHAQPGSRYLQHQQAPQMTPQSLMAARSSMMYAQQPLSALHQQQQEAFQNQLGMRSGRESGLNMLHSETTIGGSSGTLAAGGFPDFGRGTGDGLQGGSRGITSTSKGEMGTGGSSEGQGGQRDGTEPLYLKGSEEEGN